MREIVHIQAGQCGNQIGAKVSVNFVFFIQAKPVSPFFVRAMTDATPFFFPLYKNYLDILTICTRFPFSFKVIFVQFCGKFCLEKLTGTPGSILVKPAY